MGAAPTPDTVLGVLSKARLGELGRELAIGLSASATKDALVERLVAGGADLGTLLHLLRRDELKLACRAHGLDETGRSRALLAARLAGRDLGPLRSDIDRPRPVRADLPVPRAIVRVRHRQFLVEDVVSTPLLDASARQATLVRLVCLDDDNQGRRLDVLWELELGAEILTPETHGLTDVERLDPAPQFAAYLHALRWNAVTATDARLFQAPFRAGIELLNHQLTPLKRALELPRANLFIADDVGLGKTIEAGLVLQELLLRQQVELVLIVAPASVCLQWRDEMQKRFGLQFEIYNRAFVSRRQKERGFGTNPWTTHSRFIISYQTLRRPEYRDPLLARLGDRARKSLLILDEAHTAAPASAQKYAVDSRLTKVIRDLAPRFDNRLFLSATPHNGHSNSFSALLELLDPQRFTRGVRPSSSALSTVMVRRLKEDLRRLGTESFPLRRIVQLDVGTPDAPEVRLSRLLAEYTQLMRPERGRGRLAFVNLQKRLLSSVEAFRRTLDVHAQAVLEGRAKTALQLDLASHGRDEDDDSEYGDDEEIRETEALATIDTTSRLVASPEGRARALLDEMRALSAEFASGADAKVLSLLAWIREHQCPAVSLGGAKGRGAALKWTDRRVLIFTEYGDTKRYLANLLGTAIDGTHLADERILHFHGGMSDEQRDEVQRAFNGSPDEYPVRILLATDAAREGVNLQGHCADLFHFDVPWNPARMEQRNGRIDRTLQPSPEVRCHYFYYPDRKEDLVLKKLVDKVEIIQNELGSLGSVVMERLATTLTEGIGEATAASLDQAEATDLGRATVKDELESHRDDARLKKDLDENGRIATSSRRLLDFDPALLHQVIDQGLRHAGATALAPTEAKDVFVLPALPDSWQRTLDTLRRARRPDEDFWEWRNEAPPLPVVFKAPSRLTSDVAHLHLSHPLVQRILGRFRAQGFSAHDLSRVTALRNPEDDRVLAVGFARLSLFGPGATRLHDQIVAVAATAPDDEPTTILPDEEQAMAIAQLQRQLRELDPAARPLGAKVEAALAARAKRDFGALWADLEAEADSVAHEAKQKLATRASVESELLRKILEEQRTAIERTLGERQQLQFEFAETEREEREQFEADAQHMADRLTAIEHELQIEPEQIRSLYAVALQRLEPVGLVYLWPETRG